MKCVCPMGGDRTCPDNCLLAAWYTLPDDQKTRARRLPIIKTLAEQGYSQVAIARQLSISQNTISLDLTTLSIVDNVNNRGTDTLGRKKSTGRPKGSIKPRDRKNESLTAEAAAAQILNGKSYAETEKETGLSNTVLRSAVAREEGRREPQFTRDDLSLSAQQKFDAAIRRYRAQLEASFAEAVRVKYQADVARYVNDELILKTNKKIEVAHKLYRHRRGAMDKTTFNMIRRALHPDSRHSISDKKLAEAFDAFMSLEKFLLDEKDSPTHFDTLPKTMAEWDKMRAAATAARRAKRQGGNSAVRPL